MKSLEDWKIESVKALSCLQPNQISQGLYKCSPMAKKLLAYTISNLKMIKWNLEKEPSYEVYFKPVQFAKALGLQRIGIKQQELIKNALEELQSSYIAIDAGDTFQTFSWVTHTLYIKKENLINIELNQKLGKALLEWQKGFTTIQLIEMGRLQSFYAMRFYEIAQSWVGKKGKDGNKQGEWYFEMSIQKIRDVFQLKDDEYVGRMSNFTTYVISNPIGEVNLKTNLNINFQKLKEGKEVLGFRFTCREKTEQLKITTGDTCETKIRTETINEEAKTVEYYKKKYPEQFARIFEEEKKQGSLFGRDYSSTTFAELGAVKRMKDLGLT